MFYSKERSPGRALKLTGEMKGLLRGQGAGQTHREGGECIFNPATNWHGRGSSYFQKVSPWDKPASLQPTIVGFGEA